MADYFMHIQFIIRKKDETKVLLNKVIEYNRDNYIILGYIFDIINKMYNYFLSKLWYIMRTIGYSNMHVRPIGTCSPKISYIGHNNNKPTNIKTK